LDIERPLFWHQGLFLQPQHFQINDRYFNALLTPFYSFSQPYLWGLNNLEIASASLGKGNFSVLKGLFLFQDGSFTAFPGNAIIEGRSFSDAWADEGRPFMVYLGLKKWNDAGENVTVVPSLEGLSKVTTRFVTTPEPEEIKDLHEGGPVTQVQRLHYLLKLCWETEKDQLGDYLLIPLTRLEKRGDQIVVAEKYIPPCLTVRSVETFFNLVKEIRDEIASRSRQLEAYKVQRGIHTAEFGARDMVYLLALRSLNRYVPQLFHLTESAQAHPWLIYGVLRQLIGELSTFSSSVNAIGEEENGTLLLPRYDHSDLELCFGSAQALVVRLLDEITAGPDYIIRLTFDGTYFAADLPPAVFEGNRRYYLVAQTQSDPKSVTASLQTIAKLSSRESLPILIARALPGATLEYLSLPPQELPRRALSLYFQIDHHHGQWAQVQKGNNIALYWDTAPEDLGLELMVVGRP
jgi:type VI secretion system protein ImpJ